MSFHPALSEIALFCLLASSRCAYRGYSEQLQAVQAEMQQQVHEGGTRVGVHPGSRRVVQAQTHAIVSELQAVETRFEAHVRQQQAALTEAAHGAKQREARQAPHEAKKPASPRSHEANVKLLTLRQRDTVPSEKRAAVYALLEGNHSLSSYEIAEQTGYPPSTIQRYMRNWKTRKDEATSEAAYEATHTAS